MGIIWFIAPNTDFIMYCRTPLQDPLLYSCLFGRGNDKRFVVAIQYLSRFLEDPCEISKGLYTVQSLDSFDNLL